MAHRQSRSHPVDAAGVLVVNFVDGLTESEARAKVQWLGRALRESSRWQGFRDPVAPPFLDYRIVDIVDLTKPRGEADRNSARFPRAADGVGFDYGAFYEMRLHDGRRLDELTERGLINEVWLLADPPADSAPDETVEVKRSYNLDFQPLGFERHAGNSGSHVRRGSAAACASCSSTSTVASAARWRALAIRSSGWRLRALPYYERHSREFAMLDLDRRLGLPFESLYLCDAPGRLPDALEPSVPRGLAPAHGP